MAAIVWARDRVECCAVRQTPRGTFSLVRTKILMDGKVIVVEQHSRSRSQSERGTMVHNADTNADAYVDIPFAMQLL